MRQRWGLRQGGKSLKEYMDDFQALSRYAPDDVDTDAKRKSKFLRGLNDELRIPLSIAYTPNYQKLLDQALVLEDGMKKAESRKRRFGINKHHSEPSFKKHSSHDNHRYHGGSSHHGGNHHHGGSSHRTHNNNNNGGFRGNHSEHKGNGHVVHNSNTNGHSRPNAEPMRDISQVLCYKCKNKGHYATDCPEKKNDAAAAKPNPFQKGHVNHINVEEVMDEPDAVIGRFLLNSHTALVLFDTGASHSFISRSFVNKHGLAVENIGCPIRVSSPGGEMIVSLIATSWLTPRGRL